MTSSILFCIHILEINWCSLTTNQELIDNKLWRTAMTEWLCCLARTNKVLYLNIGTTRHRMTLDKFGAHGVGGNGVG